MWCGVNVLTIRSVLIINFTTHASSSVNRFCVGDRFYLCDNKILCEYDYEERLVFANMAYNPSSLAHIRRQVSNLQVRQSFKSVPPRFILSSSNKYGLYVVVIRSEIIFVALLKESERHQRKRFIQLLLAFKQRPLRWKLQHSSPFGRGI